MVGEMTCGPAWVNETGTIRMALQVIYSISVITYHRNTVRRSNAAKAERNFGEENQKNAE